MRVHSFNNKAIYVCIFNVCAHMRIPVAVDSLPCHEISRMAFIGVSWQKHAAAFQGWQNFKVQRHFEEIQYLFMQ